MNIPFTTEQFFEVIKNYNTSFFPVQLILLIAGGAALIFARSPKEISNRIIVVFLGVLWIWIGIAYHIVHFTSINKAAYGFGALFILQGLLFLTDAFITKRIKFGFNPGIKDYAAYVFILFGLVFYPVLIYFLEGSLGLTISLGLPCPSTIFTFGFLMLAGKSLPKYYLIIPIIWTVIGTSAAFNFGVYPDYMMPVAAITALFFLFKDTRKSKTV